MKMTKKTAILFAAVMLISAVTAVAAFAHPSGIGKGIIGKGIEHARMVVGPLIMGHGFALNGDQYHILDLTAIKTHRMNNVQNTTKTTARLRFAGQAYALNITAFDNQSLTGDVLTLPPHGTNQTGFTPSVVGHISLSTSKYEGEMLSTGTLTMNNTDYKVLLTSPLRFRNW